MNRSCPTLADGRAYRLCVRCGASFTYAASDATTELDTFTDDIQRAADEFARTEAGHADLPGQDELLQVCDPGAWPLGWSSEPDEQGRVFLSPEWDVIDGQDVCPACITPDEDRSAGWTFAAEIRRVARFIVRTRATSFPEAVEAAAEWAAHRPTSWSTTSP